MNNQYFGTDLVELIKHLSAGQDGRRLTLAEGLITSTDPKTYMAKVMLQPQGVETGWLRIGSLAAGPGWGAFHLPPNGTLVTVGFLDGDVDNGRLMFAYSNATDTPPVGLVRGEILLQHASGSALHFDIAGNVNVIAAAGVNVIAQGDLQVTALQDLTAIVGRDVTVSAAGDLAAVVGGDGTISAVGDIAVTSAGNIALDSGAAITLTAVGALNLIAAAINITGPIAAASGLALTVTGNLVTSVSGDNNITAAAMNITAPTNITGATAIGPSTTIDGGTYMGHTHYGVEPGVGDTGYVNPGT